MATSNLEYLKGINRLRRKDRQLILERDDYTCQECHVPLIRPIDMKRFPHVHHKDGNNGHNDQSNLVSLCSGCHLRIGRKKFTPRSKSNHSLSYLSELLGVSRMTITLWNRKGLIKSVKVGSKYEVSDEEIGRLKKLPRFKDTYSIQEFSRELGIKVQTVKNLIKLGFVLSFIDIEGRERIFPSEVEKVRGELDKIRKSTSSPE